MFESLPAFHGGTFAELDRLQREMEQVFGSLGQPSSIRAVGRGAFPPVNIGSTPSAVEIYAFAPGIDPAKLEVSVDRGLLTLAGERTSALPEARDKTNVYAHERFVGKFRRVVSLPEDVDPARVQAQYRDGVLRVSVARRESAQPRRIEIR